MSPDDALEKLQIHLGPESSESELVIHMSKLSPFIYKLRVLIHTSIKEAHWK